MSLRSLPEPRALNKPQNFKADMPADAMARWAAMPHALDTTDDDTTITIYDTIGYDPWTGEGVTAKRISAALRRIGPKDVTVKINSPGGDMFEGIAIYNALRQHKAAVNVQVLGIAASAASIIAMAGDEIVMGLGTFIMVHNAWGLVIGNQHDLREASDLFAQFDSALADIYEARTSTDRSEIEKLMDNETFLAPADAVAKGFADRVDDGLSLPDDNSPENSSRAIMARRQTEAALAQSGLTREERTQVISELTGGVAAPRDASRDNTNTAPRDASRENEGAQRDASALADSLRNLLNSFN